MALLPHRGAHLGTKRSQRFLSKCVASSTLRETIRWAGISSVKEDTPLALPAARLKAKYRGGGRSRSGLVLPRHGRKGRPLSVNYTFVGEWEEQQVIEIGRTCLAFLQSVCECADGERAHGRSSRSSVMRKRNERTKCSLSYLTLSSKRIKKVSV